MSVGKNEVLMTVLVHSSGRPQHQHLQFERLLVRIVLCLVFPQAVILEAALSHGRGPDQRQDQAGGPLVLVRGGWGTPEPRPSARGHLCRAWTWWASPQLPLFFSLRRHTKSRVTAEVVADGGDQGAEWLTQY